MRPRLVLSIAFAMATVAPVMSAPTPARVIRDVNSPTLESADMSKTFDFTTLGQSETAKTTVNKRLTWKEVGHDLGTAASDALPCEAFVAD